MRTAVWYRARAQMRSSLVGMIVLVVLVAVPCGVVLASAAGARRTASAYPRMLEATNAPEILISPNGDGTGTAGFYDEVGRLPGVRSTGALRGIGLVFVEGERAGSMVPGATIAPIDDALGVTIGVPKVLEGRMWDPTRPDELVVNRFFRSEYGADIGDRITFDIPSFLDDVEPVRIEFTIVGVILTAQEVVPFTDLDQSPSGMLSPAVIDELTETHAGFEGLVVDVDSGTDVPGVVEQIDAVAGRYQGDLPEGIFSVDLSGNVEQVNHSIRPLAAALAIFAVVMALVVVVVIGQSIRRHVSVPASEVESLDAIGFRRRERRVVLAVRGAVIGAGAAGLAAVVAVAASGRFPIGPARLAEPNGGLALDLAVLVPGVLAVLAFCVLSAAAAAERAAPSAADMVTPASRMRASPAVSAGLRAAWPVRSNGGIAALAAAVGGVMAVLAAATFSASLDDLVERPVRYGQSWDRMVDGQFGPAPLQEVFDRFGDDRRVQAIALGDYGEAVVGDERIPAISWDTVKGDLDLVAVRGRPATDGDEIALGGETLDELGLDIGDTVEVDVGDGAQALRVVGQVVFPRFGLGSFATTGLGVGAQLHVDAMPPQSMPPGGPAELPPLFAYQGRLHNFAALDVADGPDGSADPDALASVDRDLEEIAAIGDDLVGESFLYRRAQRPTTISDLDRVRSVPALLALALAGLAAATLAHSLASSLRGRRRELAIMAALGLERRQLAATVLWHAIAVALAAAFLATPAGAAVGRVAWRAFAGEFHVPARPVVPLPTFAAVVLAAMVVAAVAAVPFAVRAARTRPAGVLRTE